MLVVNASCYSNDDGDLLTQNCTYYWGSAAFVSYFVNHPKYTPPSEQSLSLLYTSLLPPSLPSSPPPSLSLSLSLSLPLLSLSLPPLLSLILFLDWSSVVWNTGFGDYQVYAGLALFIVSQSVTSSLMMSLSGCVCLWCHMTPTCCILISQVLFLALPNFNSKFHFFPFKKAPKISHKVELCFFLWLISFSVTFCKKANTFLW